MRQTEIFINKCIRPFENGLNWSNTYDSILHILKDLEKHGQCPSVENRVYGAGLMQKFGGGRMGKARRLALMEITLLEHSLNVAENLSRRAVNDSIISSVIGNEIIMGLAHDIGKSPTLCREMGLRNELHQLNSADYLTMILPETMNSKTDIIKVVKDHHSPVINSGRDSQTQMIETNRARLQQADTRAREMEIVAKKDRIEAMLRYAKKPEKRKAEKIIVKRQELLNLSAWLDLEDDILERIADRTNIQTYSHMPDAAVYLPGNEMVYVVTSFISQTVSEMAREAGKSDIAELVRDNRGKRILETSVRELLADYVPDYIGPTFAGRKHRFDLITGRTITMVMLPIEMHAFDADQVRDFNTRAKTDIFASRVSKISPVMWNGK